jgi:arylsulfatase A-like enzyme
MPAVARFAKKGVIFDNFFAASNHTSTSMNSLFTGLYPSGFEDVRKQGWHSLKLTKEQKPVQLRLSQAGYRTVTTVGHGLAGPTHFFGKINKCQGKLKGREVAETALRDLRSLGPNPAKPTFYVMHFFDPHHSYAAPVRPTRFGYDRLSRYRAELAYVDEALAPVLDLMQQEGFREWLVIFTSDHGEAFKEHGNWAHGFSLYDEEVRVPLILRVPGVSPRRVAITTSHLDLLPTIMAWCGLSVEAGLAGKTLLPALADNDELSRKRRFVYSEFFRIGDKFAIYDGRYSLLYSKKENQYEMYDKKKDPGQKKNIFDRHDDPLMKGLLRQHVRESLKRLK